MTGGQRRSALVKAADSVPFPIPPEDMEMADGSTGERELPKDEAPRGIDPDKWVLMNRAQRRAAKAGKA
jgi:hypothetical protein